MSNLRVHVDQSNTSLQQPANPACAEAPPVSSGRGPRPADACRLTLPLTLDMPNPPAPRQIALDRQGDRFVVSASNSPENLTWLASHQNLPNILEIARLSEALLRGTGRRAAATDPFTLGFFLWVSRYIMTGRVPLDGAIGSRINQMDLEGQLLELFTGSWAHGLAPLVGNINMLRREPSLTEETRERIQRITGILDLVPQYRSFLGHFVTESEQANLGGTSDDDFRRLGWVFDFVRRAVLNRSSGRPLRYDAGTLSAVRAYQELHRAEISSGTRPDFCAALRSALQERGGVDAPAANFLEECRSGIELAAQAPLTAFREALRASLVNPIGLSRLQHAIAEESARLNMRIDWLRRRGSFGSVFAALRESIRSIVAEGRGTQVSFDIAQFRQRLRLMTSLTERGEYDLAALAFLRTMFGTEGTPPRLRAFADAHYQDLEWNIPAGELGQIRDLMASLAGRRLSASNFATTGMAALLGTGCALGTGGLILSHSLPAIVQNRDLQLGLGSASAGLAGGGCLGLAGHYVWPAAVPRAVHNRYAWDLGSAGVGTGVGIATYLLINLLTAGAAGRANPRFPVDPYGP